jgi:hypothetical protein
MSGNPGPSASFYLPTAIFGGGGVLFICVAGIRYQMRKASGYVPPPRKKRYPRSSGDSPDIVVVDMSCCDSSRHPREKK